MAIETEIKLRVGDLEALRRRLQLLNATLLSGRHFEDNYALDHEDGRIRRRGSLLRVRITDTAAYLTFKGPSRIQGIFKTREELETRVDDGDIVRQILERLGMSVSFRYQKYREEYSIAAGGEVHVALDETPVGSFAELEGSEESIVRVARELGYEEGEFLRDSYYALYLDHCRARGSAVGHMVFR